MNPWMQDARFALRLLRKSPGFTLTAVLTLALAIGAAITMYSVVRNVLLEPLPYPEQQRLVGVSLTFPQERPNNEQAGTGADFIKEHARSFESTALLDDGNSSANLSYGDESSSRALKISSHRVSHGYFPTLGLQPVLGRNFTAEEDLPAGPKAVLLSYGLWTRIFNRDRGVLNRVVHLNEESFMVIGVMPASIADAGEAAPGRASAVDLWQPLQLSAKDPGYGGDNYEMIARLRPAVSLTQAQQELDALKGPFYQKFPDYLRWTTKDKLVHEFRVWPLKEVMVSRVRPSLLALTAAVIAVLLVACLNLAGLMMARGSRRTREIALRTALGATRGSVLRLLLCESLLLALAGGVLGLLLARAMIPALLAASPLPLPQMQQNAGSWPLLGFSLLVACAATLVFGLIPALGVCHPDAGALQSGHSIGTSPSQARLGKTLMIGQVALAMVLLSAASLLLGSFLKLRSVPSGVEAKRLVIAQVALKGTGYASTLHTTQFIERVMAKLAGSPGVERVAAVNGLPLDRGLNMSSRPADRPEMMRTVELRVVTPGYFRTLGIPVMSGRDFTEVDSATAAPVVLVSETAARRWWPGRSPIGDQVVAGGKGEGRRTVVGVVADIHSHSLAEAPQIIIYEPFAQASDGLTKAINGWFPTSFAIRLSGDIDMAAAVERAVSDADADMPVAKFESMQAVIDGTLGGPQFFSWLAGGFAGFALLLTVIGLFGMLNYQVTQRTREIGVRLAVGADRGQILMLVLGRGLLLTTIGLVIGTIASLAVPQMVKSVLADNIYSGDAGLATALSNSTVALTAAAIAMILAASTASYLPARRAASIEPTEALRTE
jgi:predicted permease